jgi:hypothetical protein
LESVSDTPNRPFLTACQKIYKKITSMPNQTTVTPIHYPVKASGDLISLYFRQFFKNGFDKKGSYSQTIF